ncbi:alpha/beta fold hydrolase [Litorimonas taeanensis]|nr:alpha/beta hydrolase [Litorimonas taeanensis]
MFRNIQAKLTEFSRKNRVKTGVFDLNLGQTHKMNFSKPDFIKSDGYNIATYRDGPEDGPLLILIHGWPEIAYSWKTTVPALTGAGYRVITYDLRGFGRSDAPHGIEHYAITQMVADLDKVIEAQGRRTATLIGHDWGGIIMWQAGLMLAHRIERLISICTPHVKHAPVDPLKIFRKRYGKDHYFLEFRDRPEEIAALFASNPDAFFRLMFRTTRPGQKMEDNFTHIPKNFLDYLLAGEPKLLGAVMSEKDRTEYTRAYEKSGFHGGMSLYRNTTQNWELARGLPEKIDIPSLMLSPENDLILPPQTTDHMPAIMKNLTRQTVPDCGHWAMWDNPNFINKAILNWLTKTPIQKNSLASLCG